MLEDFIVRANWQTDLEDFFAPLIEAAYLAGQIDGDGMTLAYAWMGANSIWTH